MTFRKKRNVTVNLGNDDPDDDVDPNDDDSYMPDDDLSEDTDASVCEEDEIELVVAYQFNINSIPDMEYWPVSNGPIIQPPAMKKGIGRPSRNRKREEDEQQKGKRSRTVKCSKCKEFGHNAATFGPKMDIMLEEDEQKTGFLTQVVDEYAEAIIEVLTMPEAKKLEIAATVRMRAARFSEEKFYENIKASVQPILCQTS
ncbi:GDP-Man:Man(3)GlcNAc(2)-PP-Dol alpha-1 2-mannosyltransferase [Bienertia sinuspersici]